VELQSQLEALKADKDAKVNNLDAQLEDIVKASIAK